MKKLALVLMITFVFGCHSQTNTDSSEIYTLLINRLILPIPPPPPLNDKEAFLSNEKIDSLKRIPMKIAVFPHKIKFSIKKKNGEFLLNDPIKHEISDKEIEFNKLKARANISLKLITNPDDNVKTIHSEYDGILTISSIEYTKEKTKAVALMSYSRGKLSGSLMMFYLEKKDNLWTIVSSKTLLVS